MGTTNNHLSIINNHFAFAALHLSRTLYKSAHFMQNKANLLDAQMNVKSFHTVDYENKSDWTLGENEPNTNPIKPNFRKAQMNVNSLIAKDYRKYDDFAVQKNKPNSKPIKPNPPARYAIRNTRYEIQTQSKPISKDASLIRA